MNKLIYISAEWCNPCKMFGPVMSEVASSGIPVEKLDADRDQNIVMKYGVRNIPTVVKVDANGNALGKFVGSKSKQEVINFYNN
ncbi:thioredoxin family protein [bacterium]|nr:thioredoxin family protein [bacterium]MDB4319796.1 thioredoxin family protein [bacterium]MDB9992543.1 thioredoxin family protein [bacterium]